VHKNITNLMVKPVSDLESRVKNYRGKTKKKKEGSACMHACMCQVRDRWRWEVPHMAGWLAVTVREMEVGTKVVGWLG
jgi:hypothetical protein